MEAKQVAELAAPIVSSALQGGHIASSDVDTVCAYYKAVHACIAQCANNYDAAIMASLSELS